ncbi:murein hydrolase activator NlpD [Vibrio sp. ZSDE26]|uniref:Murein hydrolase activator NlpD n=1 Tax=Vibrio amylolyticus TaxID=2847292 RepID=A0A9X1XJZ0_9VIBR|nr:murein hydrolase activator NlpD [Vibrio amylolyticus]MCK6262315.1 murein hydrolase activator NlpD [Vibrio amylolyticus]
MRFLSRNLLVLFLLSLLIGCAARNPAPVSGLNKDYSSVSRGSYRGSFYQVKKGDTLYFISYITDKDVKEIIRYNNLKAPYTIHPGQKLNLWRKNYVAPAFGGTGAGAVTAASSDKTSKNSNQKKTATPTKVVQKDPPKKVDQSKSKEYVKSTSKQNVNKPTATTTPKNDKVSSWIWPTKGRIIKKFSAGEQGNKGIDIAGQRGQSIVSTAGGTVVYSGNALRGYGNLVIVKHNDNYLSAYAHNDRLLVQEGQNVKAGQKIATMGSSGTSSVRLHFEIRYQGKSVNPNRYLP